jgi:hypothetical protein
VVTFVNATVGTLPSTSTSVVRKTDVDISPDFGPSLAKVTVSGGFITAVVSAVPADLPVHNANHHSTSLTTSTPAGEDLGDSLYSYQVGAVERANPVVSAPIKMTTTADHTYAEAVDYFHVIASDSSPNTTGPEGQIIFRRSL